MNCNRTTRGDVLIVRPIQRDLTRADVVALRRMFRSVRSQNRRQMVLDLSLVVFIDSSALAAMVAECERARGLGFRIWWARPTDSVRTLLELMALHHLIQVFPYVIHACRRFELEQQMSDRVGSRRSA